MLVQSARSQPGPRRPRRGLGLPATGWPQRLRRCGRFPLRAHRARGGGHRGPNHRSGDRHPRDLGCLLRHQRAAVVRADVCAVASASASGSGRGPDQVVGNKIGVRPTLVFPIFPSPTDRPVCSRSWHDRRALGSAGALDDRVAGASHSHLLASVRAGPAGLGDGMAHRQSVHHDDGGTAVDDDHITADLPPNPPGFCRNQNPGAGGNRCTTRGRSSPLLAALEKCRAQRSELRFRR